MPIITSANNGPQHLETLAPITAQMIVANAYAQLTPAQVVPHDDIFRRILDALEPLDFRALAEAYHVKLGDDTRLPMKYVLVLCINELLNQLANQHCGLAAKDDFVFAYNGAFWKELDRAYIKDFLGRAADKLGVQILDSQHYEFREKLYKQFLSAAYLPPQSNTDVTHINLANGTFVITAEQHHLREFRPQDFLTYQLPFGFDERATCPRFQAYLDRVLPERELQNILAEFFGYVFTKHLKLEKALLLYGSGANGKSVLFDVVNALLGRENITNFSLANLLEEHNRALIAHKLLNYGSEINATKARDEFKILVSGEPIQARLKYGNSFTMSSYAKLAFNCNELPKDFDHQTAYFRRLLIIPFNVTVPEHEQNKTLAQDIISTELAGVFNWVLDGLRRLLRQHKFTHSPLVQTTLETYKRESDSVACFLNEHHYQPDTQYYQLLSSLYPAYRTFCLEDGHKPLKKLNFRKRLEVLGYPIDQQNDGNRVYLSAKK